MAKYNYEVAGVEEQFEVEDSWLKNLKLNPFSSLEEQVYKAALLDPEKSGLTVSNDAVKGVIDAAKELVAKAKEVNRNHPEAKVRAVVSDITAGTFDVLVAGNVRNKHLPKDQAKAALDEVEAFFAHNNLIHVAQIAIDTKATPEKIAEDITITLNNAMKRGDARKILDVYPIPGVDAMFFNYVSKSAFNKLNSYDADSLEIEDEEDEEDSEY